MRRLSTRAAILAALVLCVPGLHAQRPTGRIDGTVRDSVHDKPLVGAALMLTSVTVPSTQLVIALSDDRGRFRFDTLAAGRYSLELAHPILDSLELTMPPREVTVGEGDHASVEMGIPSGATFRAAACPGLEMTKEQGAVVGRAVDADTDRPLVGARVAVSWNDFTVDRATLRADPHTRTGGVVVDSLGRYRLCGVPTETYLLLQLQADGRVGTTLRVSVPADLGVILRHLSLSPSTATRIAAIDTSASAEPPPLRSGTATITGSVLGLGSRPVAEAQVRVLDAVGMTRTDSAGRFTLSNLPAGTQVLEVRQVGYLLTQNPVELRSGRSVEASVTMARIVSLDSIRVVARRSLYKEFESRRRLGRGFGRFMDEEEIDRRSPMQTSDLLRVMPGFRVSGSGLDAKIISSRGRISLSGRECETNVVIDGIQHQDINLLSPREIGALEAYPGQSGAPIQYESVCGVIVITTKR